MTSLLLVAAGCLDRGTREVGTAVRVEAGRSLFVAYCTSCHGGDARGGGPVAATLSVPPADLTRIALRRGGHFDASAVAFHIDGRTEVPAHGTREMPVWGRRLDDRNASMPAEEMLLAPDMIRSIVAYLESIQVEASP